MTDVEQKPVQQPSRNALVFADQSLGDLSSSVHAEGAHAEGGGIAELMEHTSISRVSPSKVGTSRATGETLSEARRLVPSDTLEVNVLSHKPEQLGDEIRAAQAFARRFGVDQFVLDLDGVRVSLGAADGPEEVVERYVNTAGTIDRPGGSFEVKSSQFENLDSVVYTALQLSQIFSERTGAETPSTINFSFSGRGVRYDTVSVSPGDDYEAIVKKVEDARQSDGYWVLPANPKDRMFRGTKADVITPQSGATRREPRPDDTRFL